MRALLIAFVLSLTGASSAFAGGIFGASCAGLTGAWKLQNALEQASQEAKRFPAVSNEICERLQRQQAQVTNSAMPASSPRAAEPEYELPPQSSYDAPSASDGDQAAADEAAKQARLEQRRLDLEVARTERGARAERRRAEAQAAREAAAQEEAAKREAEANVAAAKVRAQQTKYVAKITALTLAGGLLLWGAWAGRATIMHLAYGLTPHRKAVWPSGGSSSASHSGGMTMSNDPRTIKTTDGSAPTVRPHPMPAAPFGIPIFGVMRNTWEKEQLESFTELERAVTAHVQAQKAQIDAKGELMETQAHWEGRASEFAALRAKSAHTVAQDTDDLLHQGEVAKRARAVELAKYDLELKRIQKASEELDNPKPAPTAPTEADLLGARLQQVRDLEAVYDFHIADVVKRAGGEENLTDDDRRYIDQVEVLKAEKTATLFEGWR